MIMEDDICILVLARLDIEPQLPHEEDLVGVVGNSSVPGGSGLLDPVCQASDEVKEEIIVRD